MNILQTLLEKNRAFKPSYKPSEDDIFSNHLSMVLIALSKMGATDQELESIFDCSAPVLERVTPSSCRVTQANWREHFGKPMAYLAYFAFFKEESERVGREVLLKTYLPDLLPGVATHLFHGLIRLSYGIDADDSLEIIAGLAYWASGYTASVFSKKESPSEKNPIVIIEKIHVSKGLKQLDLGKQMLSKKLHFLSEHSEFNTLVNELMIEESSLPVIANTALQLYLGTKNFFLLHVVTSAHALRLLLPFIEDKKRALQHYWRVICGVYVATGCLDFSTVMHGDKIYEWPDIQKTIVTLKDDHVIKLAYTCREEQKAYHNVEYQKIASDLICM